jgi:N-dimethylarginine dimethylaminohydrolase
MIRHRAALMCPPLHFTVRDTKNPFMICVVPVDRALASEQWAALRTAFELAGVSISTIDPVEDLEDMVFTANQVFVGSGAEHARFIVPSRMRFASREREVPYFVAWFRDHAFEVVELGLDAAAGEYLEGHGDLLAHPGYARVWAGHGIRSSREGVARFASAMKAESIEVVPLELVDPTFYHLDTCLAPLNADSALVYGPAFSPASFATLRRCWPRLHSVSQEDAYRFVCNGIAVNGRFIVSHLSDAIADVVQAEGLHPCIVETSEFEKAGGSVFCLKVFLD